MNPIIPIPRGVVAMAIHPQSVPALAFLPQRLGVDEQKKINAGYPVVGGIAIIEIRGVMTHEPEWWMGETDYVNLRQAICSAAEDEQAKAILLLINSPGGEVAGMFAIAELIRQTSAIKPVWAVLDEIAYSAAYLFASAASRVIVPVTGGVGSIGIIAVHMDISQHLEQMGIKPTFLHYGDAKTDGWPELPLSDEAKARQMEDIETMGNLFVETVARYRKLSPAAVKATQARTFMGAKGVAEGLADQVASPDQAFQELYATLR